MLRDFGIFDGGGDLKKTIVRNGIYYILERNSTIGVSLVVSKAPPKE